MGGAVLRGRHRSGGGCRGAIGDGVWVEVDAVWIRWLGECGIAVGWRFSVVGGAAHVEAVLDEGDAEACS